MIGFGIPGDIFSGIYPFLISLYFNQRRELFFYIHDIFDIFNFKIAKGFVGRIYKNGSHSENPLRQLSGHGQILNAVQTDLILPLI